MDYLERKRLELEQYLPPQTKRPDFETFWTDTIAATKANPLNFSRKTVDFPLPGVEVFDITYHGFDTTPIHGWLLIPSFLKKEKLPCLIHYHGFNGSRGLPHEFSSWLMMGLAVISVDCREQCGDTGNNASYTGGMISNVTTKGILNKNEYYYRAVYMDCLRAIDVAEACAEIDTNKIIIHGGSQGGALGVAVCCLDRRPALALVDVPSSSNLEARVEGNHGSFAAVRDYLKRYPSHLQQAYETLSYFDTMNMAENIACPVFASVGLEDNVCPAKCFYATYNRIQTQKEISVYPFNGHEGGGSGHMVKKLAYLANWLAEEDRRA